MKPASLAALAVVLCAAAPLTAQPKPSGTRQRDLYTEEARPPAPRPSIPRSYALVVGISNYRSLKPEQQLRFAERDAEAMFSILISTEGGNFPAENVRLLTGSKATLANLRRELNRRGGRRQG